MKKSGLLIRRSVLFTSIMVAIAIVVTVPVFIVTQRIQVRHTAQAQLLSQARVLASTLSADDPSLEEDANLLCAGGLSVILSDGSFGELPAHILNAIESAQKGLEQTGTVRYEGRSCAYAAVMMTSTAASALPVVVVLLMPLTAYPSGLIGLLIGLLAGLLVTAACIKPLVNLLLTPVVSPIRKVRRVAEQISEGDLELRCDTTAPGEAGQLGRAINALSDQLATNMYSLIIERNRLKRTINGLHEGVIAVDVNGNVTHTNPALETLFEPHKLALHLPDKRMRIVDQIEVWQDFDRVLKDGIDSSRNINSRDRIIRCAISPTIDDFGAIAGAVGLFSDITEQERLDQTRREYVSNVSHELRTPLTGIRALIEPLKDGLVTDESARMHYYDTILREVMRLSRLINDQLELSRLQSGNVSIEKKRFRPDDLIYDVCERCAALAEEKGLKLLLNTDFSQCPSVYSNEDRVEQLLIILLDNAIKYTEKGNVSLYGVWDDEKVTLSVQDTGIGIDENDLPYVFDRFYKVDKAHSGKGSGLGLSIAYEVITRMGEQIWVASEKGKGTCFNFTIHRNEIPKEK